MIFFISSTLLPVLSPIYAIALFWSNLVKAVKFYLAILGANLLQIIALVLAGLPTTTTLQSLLATLFILSPYCLNIIALALNRSFLSIPGPLGLAPTNIANSQSLNPESKSVVPLIEFKQLNAESFSSIMTPSNADLACGSSKRVKSIFYEPNI